MCTHISVNPINIKYNENSVNSSQVATYRHKKGQTDRQTDTRNLTAHF
jgi:hypothetical protein